jgi:hypothetical protein
MVDGLALRAGAASAEAFDDLRKRKVVVDHSSQRPAFGLDQPLQRLRLSQCAREAVENEPAPARETGTPLPHHLPDSGIRNKRAFSHEIERRDHSGRHGAGAASGGPKHIAGRKVACTQALMKQVRLRAFADSGGSEKNKPPRATNFGLRVTRR